MFDLDPLLHKISQQYELEPIKSSMNVFHDLVGIVIEQQIHYRSTKKTFQKLIEKSGIEQLTIHNFERFEKLSLKESKLSMKKYEALLSVYDFFKSHDIDWKTQSDQMVKSILTSLKGVSEWSAEMILIYTLNRPDIFPKKDYHINKILADLYPNLNPITPSKVALLSKTWEPNKSLAMHYLLATKS